MGILRRLLVTGVVVVLGASWAAPAEAVRGRTTRVSVSNTGAEANDVNAQAAVSADGRYVAFTSFAANLVPGDTNGTSDVFVRDLWTRTMTRVSVSSTGAQADDPSSDPDLSADGRYVAFTSFAANLVPGDTNAHGDLFVRDLRTGTTIRANVSSTGEQANEQSYAGALAPDGRYITFPSVASNLVPGDTNGVGDVFVRDLRRRTIARVSVSSAGEQANDYSESPVISAGGRYVAFVSFANNLAPGVANGLGDVYLRDLSAQTTSRASVSSTGEQANMGAMFPALSAGGRHLAFASSSTNLTTPGEDTNGAYDVFVRDLLTGVTSRVSVSTGGAQAAGASVSPDISATGRYLAFESEAPNLVPGDTNGAFDVFVRDLRTGTTSRVSVAGNHRQANGAGSSADISATGRYVAFESAASNLVPGDTNGVTDVFLRER
jgi:Tol biopolymer transport system component